jgi:exosortase K
MLTRAGKGGPVLGSALAGGAALAVALGAKAFYSHAGANQLVWILAPSSWLARAVGGVALSYEDGAGFISHAHHLVVGKPCAGVNFLVVAFLTLFFAFGGRFAGLGAQLGWLLASLGLAYVAAVVTNGARIALAAYLFDADIYGGLVTPGRIHRLAGTAVYYGSLWGLFFAVGAALKTRGRRLVPLGAYALVSIGVPLAGRLVAGGGDGARFAEHVAWVTGIAGVVTAAVLIPALLRDRIQWKT